MKAALRQAQHDKCAFCESKIAHTGYGDVENFRPKAGYKQRETDSLQYPGYYWLAYEWSNLFLSCQLCNQRFKRNCFPLRVQKHRARSHKGNISKEKPLLVSPTDKPENHLTFVAEMVAPRKRVRKGKTTLDQKGQVTIDALGLNRAELVEYRLERRRILIELRTARELLQAVVAPDAKTLQALANIQQLLNDAVTDQAEYATMARVTLA